MNMREIKFRVWDSDLKKYANLKRCVIYPETGKVEFPEGGWDLQGYTDDACILEQFTGLLDKNGKEIYEGDILKISNFNMVDSIDTPGGVKESFEDIYCEVSFEDGGFVFYSEDHGHIPIGVIDSENFEVIGNIHQNPELV